MKQIPTWLEAALHHLVCPNCNYRMHPGGVISIGIKKIFDSKKQKQTVLFFRHVCSKCRYSAEIDSDEMSLEDFAFEVLDDLSNNIDKENPPNNFKAGDRKARKKIMSKNLSSSKITQYEADAYSKMTDKCKNHEEFMISIGLTHQQIIDSNSNLRKFKRKISPQTSKKDVQNQ